VGNNLSAIDNAIRIDPVTRGGITLFCRTSGASSAARLKLQTTTGREDAAATGVGREMMSRGHRGRSLMAGEAEVADDPLSVRVCSFRFAVQHETRRSRNCNNSMSSHEVASTLLGSHLLSFDPVDVAYATNNFRNGALQENGEQLPTVPLNYQLEPFECWEVVRLDVDKRHHQQGNTFFCGRVQHSRTYCLDELPEAWCPKIKHGSGHVDSSVVIKQSPLQATEQSSRGRELSRSRRPMNEHKFHAATVVAGLVQGHVGTLIACRYRRSTPPRMEEAETMGMPAGCDPAGVAHATSIGALLSMKRFMQLMGLVWVQSALAIPSTATRRARRSCLQPSLAAAN